MVCIMNRKGPGGARLPGKKKGDGKNKAVRRTISFHGRNLRLISSPLLVIFIFVRSIAYQFFLAIIFIGHCSRRALVSRGLIRANPCPHEVEPGAVAIMSSNRGILSPGPGEPALSMQKKHHRKAFEYISKALKIDEEDGARKDIAVELYKRGINELEKGVAVDVGGQGETYDRAKRLKEKMITNLVMVRDRLEILEALLASLNMDEKADEASSSGYCISSTSDKTTDVGFKRPLLSKDKNHPGGVPSATTTKSPKISRPGKSNNNIPVSSKPMKMKNLPMGVGRGQSGTLPRAQGGRERKTSASSSPSSSPAPRRKPGHTRQASQPNIRNTATQRDLQNVKLKNVDKKLADVILSEIVDQGPPVSFSDIGNFCCLPNVTYKLSSGLSTAGQETSKQALQEIVILPALRPELFTGLRSPARGLLLFGPPGNGKTMLAKAVASESKSVFFNISASSLTSKWVGEGEKLVRTLFTAARELQPSIIFIDEIDSLLCERREGENDASRRLKTEFLVQFDGVSSSSDDRVLVMGATNRPQELDDAVLRRFSKRIFVAMPDCQTRRSMLAHLLTKQGNPLGQKDLDTLAKQTEGYSGSDLNSLAKDAALGPIRGISVTELKSMDANKVRPIQLSDFKESLKRIRKSVPAETLHRYDEWNNEFGDVTA